MRIGTLAATDSGFAGHLRSLMLDIELALIPAAPSGSEGTPDFRVIAGSGDGSREVGAGWKHVGDKAGDYVAIQIDDPALVQPLRANLFRETGGAHALVWSRAAKRDAAG